MASEGKQPYRLLVEHEFAPESDRYKGILRGWEVASGTLLTSRFHITNLSPLPFPGGTLTIEKHEYGSTGSGILFLQGGAAVPPLGPQERRLVYEGINLFILPGLAWLFVTAEGTGAVPLLLCKRKDAEGRPKVAFPVIVVSRIELEILLALQGKGRE